ncbi:MAG: ABC transporter permease [Armatimonadetes bacterium]|nr:ABC transporter permease [Armatimonadota bacterium]
MTRRLGAIIIKEFIQLLRDPRTLMMAILLPVMQLLLFGYAITTEVEQLPTVVVDHSRTQESRALLDRFATSRFYVLRYHSDSLKVAEDLVQGGKARVVIVVPPDFAERSRRRLTAQVMVIVDASDPLIARSALSAAEAIGQVASLEIVSRTLGASTLRVPLEVRTRAWYNPDLSSTNFMVPGLLAVVLQNITLSLTAIAIVRERELGTIEQLVVTPIRRGELMLGKILPYVVLGYVDITLALLIAAYWFEVPIRGSLTMLYLVTLFFYFSSLGLGILVSTVSRTQRQAMQASFFILLPTFIISGFMFPREGMPEFLQWLGLGLPITYFLVIVRGLILKGVGLEHLWDQIIPMALLGAVFFAFSVARFQKKLE